MNDAAQHAAQCLREFEQAHPAVTALARYASLATRVDASLLRRLRLQMVPGLDAVTTSIIVAVIASAPKPTCGSATSRNRATAMRWCSIPRWRRCCANGWPASTCRTDGGRWT